MGTFEATGSYSSLINILKLIFPFIICLFVCLFVCFLCREKALKWNGWGYNDSSFHINEKGEAMFLGKRYI